MCLQEAGIEPARVEAEALLAGALGTSRTELYLWEQPIDHDLRESLVGLVKRHIQGEPLQYLVGSAEFCGHRLVMSQAVFIPRPETEGLVEHSIEHLQAVLLRRKPVVSVLDLGTGSACIAISIAKAVRPCVLAAIELSWETLQVAKTNLEAHCVNDRVHLIQADWTSGVTGPFDLIVSNPPYVKRDELDRGALAGIREPRMSLDGGLDGMAFHRRLIAEAPRLLAPAGCICMECGEDQAGRLAQLANGQPWVRQAWVMEDLAGRPRGVWIDAQDGQISH